MLLHLGRAARLGRRDWPGLCAHALCASASPDDAPAPAAPPPRTAPLPADIAPPPAAAPAPKPAPPRPVPLPVLLDPPARPALGLAAAVAAVQSLARARFPESVDLTLRLGLDPKRSDHAVRGVAALPHGTGRTLRIAVFASGQAAADALAAGADLVGLDELVESVRAGGASAVDFDRCVATPAAMPRLGPIARILGPRGLMPNPKAGTLTADVGGAVAALRRGAAAFRSDRAGAVHMAVGRASFPGEHLAANVAAAVAAVAAARPAGAKAPRGGAFFRGATLSTTMGKGSVRLKLDARGTGLAAG